MLRGQIASAGPLLLMDGLTDKCNLIVLIYLGPNAFAGIQTKVSNHKLPDNIMFTPAFQKCIYKGMLL